jgi:hypothetical protein
VKTGLRAGLPYLIEQGQRQQSNGPMVMFVSAPQQEGMLLCCPSMHKNRTQ